MKIKIAQNRPQKSKDGIIKIAEIFYLYKKNNLILKNEIELGNLVPQSKYPVLH